MRTSSGVMPGASASMYSVQSSVAGVLHNIHGVEAGCGDGVHVGAGAIDVAAARTQVWGEGTRELQQQPGTGGNFAPTLARLHTSAAKCPNDSTYAQQVDGKGKLLIVNYSSAFIPSFNEEVPSAYWN
eukprot:scaffold14125_cov26-Tisochrysis_lutea.AAC.1